MCPAVWNIGSVKTVLTLLCFMCFLQDAHSKLRKQCVGRPFLKPDSGPPLCVGLRRGWPAPQMTRLLPWPTSSWRHSRGMRHICKLWLTGRHLHLFLQTPAACPDGLSWVAAAVAYGSQQHGGRSLRMWRLTPGQAPCSVSGTCDKQQLSQSVSDASSRFSNQACPLHCQKICGLCSAFCRACVCWQLVTFTSQHLALPAKLVSLVHADVFRSCRGPSQPWKSVKLSRRRGWCRTLPGSGSSGPRIPVAH